MTNLLLLENQEKVLLGVSETVTKDVFPYYVYRCRYNMSILHFEICESRIRQNKLNQNWLANTNFM